MAAPIHISINSIGASLFSIPSPAFIVCRFIDDGHFDWCEVISHCSFDLHFSHVWLFVTLWTVAYQAPPSMEFSSQGYRSGLSFPSPMHESEKWKWSHLVMSAPQRPHGLQPSRLLHPWDFTGKSIGVGCYCLIRQSHTYGLIILKFSVRNTS